MYGHKSIWITIFDGHPVVICSFDSKSNKESSVQLGWIKQKMVFTIKYIRVRYTHTHDGLPYSSHLSNFLHKILVTRLYLSKCYTVGQKPKSHSWEGNILVREQCFCQHIHFLLFNKRWMLRWNLIGFELETQTMLCHFINVASYCHNRVIFYWFPIGWKAKI